MSQIRILQAIGGHNIEVHGANLISDRLFDITAMVYTAADFFGEYEINNIVFTEQLINVTPQKPEGCYGMYTHATKTVTISLQKHFLATCRNIQSEEDVNAKYLSFRAAIWYDLLTSLLHEGFHAITWTTAPEHCQAAATDPIRLKEIEDDVEHNTSLMVVELFRKWDVEPSTLAEEPYLGARFMEFFIKNIQNAQTEWGLRQEIMVDSNLIYYDGNDKDGIGKMRDWLRLCYEADEGDEDMWDTAINPIPAAHVNPAVMVANVEESKEVAVRPTTQVMVVGDEKTVAETVAAVAEAQPSADIVVNDFSNLMSEADLLTDVANSIGSVDGGYVPPQENGDGIIDDSPETTIDEAGVQMQATATTAYQGPVEEAKPETPPQSEVCRLCGGTVLKGGKFCPHCGGKLVADDKTQPEFVMPSFPQTNTATPTQSPTEVVQNQFIGGAAPAGTGGAGGQGRKFTQELRTGLPNLNMGVLTMKSILAEVYKRMHNHIFEKCGFQVCGAATGNPHGFNPAMVGNILQPISIADIHPRANELIIAYDRYDPATGKTQMRVPANGIIAGKISKNNNMPFYAIYINNNGTECKRLLMAQNPFKQNANGYSQTAVKAQNGNKISWVFDGADGQKFRKWYHKIENGIAEWL